MRRPYPKLIAVILFVFTVIFAASTIPAVAESISGTVTTIGGDTIPNVCVNVSDSPCGGNWIGGAQTNNDGEYTIPGLPTGPVYISTHASCQTQNYYIDEWWDGADGEGIQDCNQAAPVTIVAGKDTPGINFSLEQGGTISGIVSGIDDNGDPVLIQNVDVAAFGEKCWGNLPVGARTIGDGSYTLVVPAGDYYVVAQTSSSQINYVTEWWNGGDGTSNCSQSELVHVAVGVDTGGKDFALQAGGSVSGTVADSQGDPIPNMHVFAQSGCNGYWLGGINTDENGEYTLFGMPVPDEDEAGVYIATCANCSGLTYIDERWDGADGAGIQDCEKAAPVQIVVGKDTQGINFSLAQGGTISGEVTDINGNGIPNVDVAAFGEKCWGNLPVGARTDENGLYTLVVPAGNYYVVAQPQSNQINYLTEWWNEGDGTSNCSAAVGVTVEATGNVGINFSLDIGATISGTITANNSVLANVNVSVQGDNWSMGTCTDSDGNYLLVVPPGSYRLSAGGRSCGTDPVTVYPLTYYSEDGLGTYNFLKALVFSVDAGENTTKNFVLAEGAKISGLVTDSDSNVLANVNVNVNVSWQDDNWGMGTCTGSDGKYLLVVPSGSDYSYWLSAGGWSCDPDPETIYALTYYSADGLGTYNYGEALVFSVGAGGIIPDKNFMLVEGATISGTVTDLNSNGLADVNVSVQGDNWGMGACTDSSGNYSILGIPPGTYKVFAGGPNWCGDEVYKQVYHDNQPDWNSADEITLSSGDDFPGINFSLELETAMSGNIRDDSEIGVRNLNVVLHDSSGRLVNWQTTWDGGYYYFDGLIDGETYTIKVYDPFLNYEYAEQGLEAHAGGQVTADFTLTSYTPSGENPPVINDAMAFIYRSPDGVESLMLTADVSDPSGCQPASLKSVTAVGPDGQLHYLYHQKYEALLGPDQTYGEFWYNSRDNMFSGSPVGDFTVTALDVEGNRVSSTATLGQYTQLGNPKLSSPVSGSQVDLIGLTLTWDPVSDAAAYQVRIYYLGERIWKSGLITGTSLSSIPPDTLSEGCWYRWEVIALDQANDQFNYYAASATSPFFVAGESVTPAGLSVNIVPWISGSPMIPHDAYAGHKTILKAVAKGGTPPYTYTWDFGDGTTSGPITTYDGYNLETWHQYGSSSTNEFSAIITVTDAVDASVSTTYPVKFWADPSRGVKVNVAIDDALWWQHKNMTRFTSAGTDFGYLSPWGYQAGSTALALQAWVLNGHGPDGDSQNPYVEDAIRARDYILTQLYPVCIGPETIAGITRDPDSNGNGEGLYVKNGHRLYETGLVLMALATLKDSSLSGTVQDLIDYLAYAQVEADVGGGRGGWRYDANYRESDMSVTQFPLMGLEAAEHHLSSSAVTIPGYVKAELKDNFLYYVQNKENGGFGYSSPDNWLNVAKTGAGLVGLALTKISYSDERATAGLDFIDANWSTADPIGPAYNIGDFYAMYAVMKGMKSYQMMGIDTTFIGGHDWYDEYAKWEIINQNSDGSWGSLVNSYGPVVDTACGVLILMPQIFEIGPTAVAQVSPASVSVGEEVTFDHSASFHSDSTKTIVTYAWDFGDGTSDSTGYQDDTLTHSYVSMGTYQATLTVTDDSVLTDTDQVTITVTESTGPVPVIVEIKPETLNLGKNGVFSAYITLAAGSQYVLTDIDPDSLNCEGAPVTKTTLAAKKLIAKFDAQDIVGVSPGDEVTLRVTGNFKDGTLFEGSDTIRVIKKK